MAGCWLGLGRRRLGLDSSRRLGRGLSPSAAHQAMSFSCRWQKPGGHAQPPEHISSSSLCCVREPSPGAKRVRRAAPSSRRRKHALQRNAESRKQRVWRRGAAENGGPRAFSLPRSLFGFHDPVMATPAAKELSLLETVPPFLAPARRFRKAPATASERFANSPLADESLPEAGVPAETDTTD